MLSEWKYIVSPNSDSFSNTIEHRVPNITVVVNIMAGNLSGECKLAHSGIGNNMKFIERVDTSKHEAQS